MRTQHIHIIVQFAHFHEDDEVWQRDDEAFVLPHLVWCHLPIAITQSIYTWIDMCVCNVLYIHKEFVRHCKIKRNHSVVGIRPFLHWTRSPEQQAVVEWRLTADCSPNCFSLAHVRSGPISIRTHSDTDRPNVYESVHIRRCSPQTIWNSMYRKIFSFFHFYCCFIEIYLEGGTFGFRWISIDRFVWNC